jgi:hypothetical protein
VPGAVVAEKLLKLAVEALASRRPNASEVVKSLVPSLRITSPAIIYASNSAFSWISETVAKSVRVTSGKVPAGIM